MVTKEGGKSSSKERYDLSPPNIRGREREAGTVRGKGGARRIK